MIRSIQQPCLKGRKDHFSLTFKQGFFAGIFLQKIVENDHEFSKPAMYNPLLNHDKMGSRVCSKKAVFSFFEHALVMKLKVKEWVFKQALSNKINDNRLQRRA
ncbi:hypothetical protein [Desertibacillus haloalkaliphilus]|uniref:hypothetical protein n=1 Tax=Desertibacillus haloalkaliphilus TaxID=1328930 RepID=UPI001C275FB9|nr:hypothetical protein [Desertibacillus haloalkaliphilus]MBU8907110.1 hypothetical protein [Desertibacillus haloalkaliphilus]